MPNDSPQAPPTSLSTIFRRRWPHAALFGIVVASSVAIGAVLSRDSDSLSSTSPSSGLIAGGSAASTASAPTRISTRAEVTSRLREILEVRDRALLARDADLLNGIYTADCKCLKDGRALIAQLHKENVIWKGVRTSVIVTSAEEVNNRLWIVIATVKTPSVRIETESGQLVRMVPPERNLVRFALARPQNEQRWLLGHASSFD